MSFTHLTVILPIIVFFCYYVIHQYLHSFPTRRSSDLVGEQARELPAVIQEDHGSGAPAAPADPGKDRKSTRLNSSHGSISYAVFCLKKKKTESSEHLHQKYQLTQRQHNIS